MSKFHLGLNISTKLNEMLLDSFVVYFRLHGPFEASFYETTFGQRPEKKGRPGLQLGDYKPRPSPIKKN